MKQCPDCSYLVPDSWEDCRRCGAPLDDAQPVATPGQPRSKVATSASGTPAVTTARPGGDTARPAAAPPAPPRAGSMSPAPEMAETPPAWTPPPRRDDVRPSDPAPPTSPFAGGMPPPPRLGGPGGASGPEASTAGMRLDAPLPASTKPSTRVPGWLVGIGVVAALVAAGWLLKGALRSESVPQAVSSYTNGTTAVSYSPPSASYTASFPTSPVHQTMTLPVMGQAFTVEVAFSEQPDLLAGVMSMNLPPGAGLTPDVLLDGGELDLSGFGGAKVTSQSEVTHQGHPALDMKVDVADGSGKLRMIIVGDRMYAAIVAGPGGVDQAFDHLVDSLVIGV